MSKKQNKAKKNVTPQKAVKPVETAKTEKKTMSKKTKTLVVMFSVVIALAVVAGIVLISLNAAGVFEKEKPTLWMRDAANGYKKHYVTGGTLPGTYAVMTVECGEKKVDAEILLMKNYAPITVNNFIAYAEEGFYDGTVIHRIVPETFTFQGGGYVYNEETGKYVSKSATRDAIRGEFASNPTGEYDYNKLSHFAGTISMARTNDKNSATSQFFISYGNYPAWDGDYAAFGFIVDSEDVKAIKEIAESVQLDASGYPKTPVKITKVKIIEVK